MSLTRFDAAHELEYYLRM